MQAKLDDAQQLQEHQQKEMEKAQRKYKKRHLQMLSLRAKMETLEGHTVEKQDVHVLHPKNFLHLFLFV